MVDKEITREMLNERYVSAIEHLMRVHTLKNQREFSAKMEENPTVFSQIKSGNRNASLTQLTKIVNDFDLFEEKRKRRKALEKEKMMAMMTHPKWAIPAIAVSSLALAGCLGPTYGTDKTAGEHLMDDLGNAMSLRKRENVQIDYAPRPDIVKPANDTVLPAPQEKVTEQEGAWPETPEARRARIRAEIDEGKKDPRFIGGADAVAAAGASEGPTSNLPPGMRRTYLTDPPSEYRQPAASAPVDELGVSESKKARQLRRASGKKTGLRRLIPWL